MEQFEIRRAERRQARLRFALCAASNGGKTWSALEIAFGIVEELIARAVLAGTVEGKIGLVDTERKSSQLYAHLGPFDTIDLGPPYTVDRYIGAVQALERAGCVVVILDSISHAWQGDGGVLALLDNFEEREYFTSGFRKAVNPAQDRFVDAMLRSPCHVIATMRSKTAWVLEEKEVRGRLVKAPRRIGLAPVQRPGIEYEFTTMVDLDTDTHVARVVKNRCPLFANWVPKVLTREHGRALAAWLLEGAPEPKAPQAGTPSERAQATAEAALRAIERAANGPDLARVFENAQRDLRAFPPAVPVEEIRPLLQRVIDSKDLRKAALGLVPPAVPVQLDPGVVADLEALLQQSGISLATCLQAFNIQRLGMLPPEELQRVVNWIADTGNGEVFQVSTRLQQLGVKIPDFAGALESMTDDLPWKD